jgi:hypothetical protein
MQLATVLHPHCKMLHNMTGAIHWSHVLLSRVKQTMAKLQVAEPEGTWRELPVGQQVCMCIAGHPPRCFICTCVHVFPRASM